MITDSTQDLTSLQVTVGDTTAPAYTFRTTGTSTPSYVINTTPNTWNPNTWSATDLFTDSQSSKLKLQGKDADIEINGESLLGMLRRIEERINILTVNQELESEWEELRELGDQYRVLENKIKHKIETWQRLGARDQDNR